MRRREELASVATQAVIQQPDPFVHREIDVYGVTSQPAARKQATARGMCIAEVTSNQRCDASTATRSSVARGLSQVIRDLSSKTILCGSIPAPSRSARATADSLSGTVSPLCTSRASGKRRARIRKQEGREAICRIVQQRLAIHLARARALSAREHDDSVDTIEARRHREAMLERRAQHRGGRQHAEHDHEDRGRDDEPPANLEPPEHDAEHGRVNDPVARPHE